MTKKVCKQTNIAQVPFGAAFFTLWTAATLLFLMIGFPVKMRAASTPPGQLTERYLGIDMIVASKVPGSAGTCSLGATVTLPARAPAKAVVLFLAGSGPMDRNGTIAGGTAMYRELAIRFADTGIASIRFDKRTLYADCATRIDESFIPSYFFDDTLAVLNATQATPELAGIPLYILGHSQGANFAIEMTARGMLAPKGLILIGGLGRFPVDATAIRQLKNTANSQSNKIAKRDAESVTKKAEDFFARLRKGTTKSRESILGAYSGFWKELQEISQKTGASAAKIKAPVLVLAGTEDNQVAREDYEALSGSFSSSKRVQSRIFENMTHLLTEGAKAGVSRALSSEIIQWIELDLADTGKK